MQRLRLAPWVSYPPAMLLGTQNLTDLQIEWPIYTGSEYYDHLTAVYNRKAYEQLLGQAIKEAAKQNAGVGLLVLDIDHFKRVNDTYGHNAGDTVLKEFANRITLSLRKNDVLARLGGEEFTVLTTCYQKVFEIGERIRLAVGQAPFIYEGTPIAVTCSFGCSVYPLDGHTQVDLFKKADQALYQAKANGRNQGIQYRKGGTKHCNV